MTNPKVYKRYDEQVGGLVVHCCRCGEKLAQQGALVFSPPIDDHVVKFHVCVACWGDVAAAITEED